MIEVTSSASLTLVAKHPITSVLLAIATTPNRLVMPYVGFTPTTPLKLAGWRIDPPVSVPSAKGTIPRATATADPPLLPPATRVSSIAFLVGPNAEFSVLLPCANESKFVLPIQIAPSASSRSTTVA